jgi:hypothetical protein
MKRASLWVLLACLLAFAGAFTAEAQQQTVTASVMYQADPFGATIIKMLEPLGTSCVIQANGTGRQFTVPIEFPAQAGTLYDFDCTLPSGAKWRWNADARAGHITVIQVQQVVGSADPFGGTGAVIQPVPVPVPVPEPVPAGPTAMADADFQSLISTVKSASFASDQVNAVKAAAKHNHFTIDQVGQMMKLMSFANDQTEVVRLMAPHVIDPQNAFKLHSLVSFSSQIDEINAIFGD